MSVGRSDPFPSFRFKVDFRGGPGVSARFTECSGLEIQVETLDYQEGGERQRTLRLPGRVKYGDLELKRGIAPDGGPLWGWVRDTARGRIAPCTLTVSLLAPDGASTYSWTLLDAYPVRWKASTFSAGESAIAIETLTIAHQGILFEG